VVDKYKETDFFEARDGTKLAYRFFEPNADSAQKGAGAGKLVLILPAAQTGQRYYRYFTAYLASKGFTVMSFDYRGVGQSLKGRLKDHKEAMHKWGQIDAPSALDFAQNNFPDLVPVAVAHSHGGQILGMSDLAVRLKKVYLIGSQLGYWRFWPRKKWPLLLFFWYIYVPFTSRILGYMYGKPMGLAAMAAPVALEWASWCRHKDYIFKKLRPYDKEVKGSLCCVTIEDDWLAPQKATLQLLEEYYPMAKSEHQHVMPVDYDMLKIGHFGWFRQNMNKKAWEKAIAWLVAQI